MVWQRALALATFAGMAENSTRPSASHPSQTVVTANTRWISIPGLPIGLNPALLRVAEEFDERPERGGHVLAAGEVKMETCERPAPVFQDPHKTAG